MPDLWDYQQRYRRWRRQVVDRLQTWRTRWLREQGRHTTLMEVPMELQQETEAAMAKAIMQQMSQQTARALKASMREELLDELRDEAVGLAKLELEDEFSRRRERLLDDLARQRRQLEDELDGEVERREKALRQEVRDTLEERLLTLQDERQEARAERDRAEGLLVALMRQLLPGERPVYLHSYGVRELDRVALNETLGRHKLRLRSKATYSERLVKTRIDETRWASHTQFWLTPVPAAGVEVEDDEVDGQGELHIH